MLLGISENDEARESPPRLMLIMVFAGGLSWAGIAFDQNVLNWEEWAASVLIALDAYRGLS